ncbi:sigma 54-interacting transcriptional regulator [Bacillus tianshenii]|nr:sigma 54-interacting transcriptional regulator [Bacillus tianshenii]
MIQLQDMMTEVHCKVHETSSLSEAVNVMKEYKYSILPITDEEGFLRGVFTRSQLYQMILDDQPLHTPIKNYIRKEVVALPLNTPYDVIEKIVEKSHVGTGVVLDEEERVIGLFTKPDMVMALLNATKSLTEQLETILHNSHLGALMTDGNERIIYANQFFCEMKGIQAEGIVGKAFSEVLPNLDVSSSIVKDVQLGERQTVLRLSSYRTVRGKSGTIALFQDMSDFEQMAQELQTVKSLKRTLDTAIEHAYDGIIMIDTQAKVKFVSPPLLELFSLEKEKILEKSIKQVLPQLNLTSVLESEEAEFSDFMEINGIRYIVNRIPVKQGNEIIGALGKVTFRQLNQVSELFRRLEKAENKAKYYHNQLKQTETARFSWEQIITKDPFMEKLKKSARKAAKGRSTVLVRGESGTGKELFAHAVHKSSARKDGKFIIVNCAAIPEHLLESEFFGYEAGAFTGAKQKGKLGKFDLADGGTLFLDEIGDMSLALQAKLLRVLQEREFYRVGGTDRIHVDVRIIAATNRPLEKMVEAGEFREDLYYRLNVISLQIPPLRKRKHDIQLLMETMMEDLNRMIGTSITGVEEKARKVIMAYDWPGNVRELRNILERAMTFAEFGKIQYEDLPDYMIEKVEMTANASVSQRALAESAEVSAIQTALAEANGNKAQAARILGISRSGLYEKIKKYEL